MLNKKNSYQSKSFIDIPTYPSENTKFIVGDIVRSYRSGFDNKLPYKNSFIEGVVISTNDKVLGEGYLVVKWYLDFYIGNVYKFKMPHNGSDTFTISINNPYLVKVNSSQLSLTL